MLLGDGCYNTSRRVNRTTFFSWTQARISHCFQYYTFAGFLMPAPAYTQLYTEMDKLVWKASPAELKGFRWINKLTCLPQGCAITGAETKHGQEFIPSHGSFCLVQGVLKIYCTSLSALHLPLLLRREHQTHTRYWSQGPKTILSPYNL